MKATTLCAFWREETTSRSVVLEECGVLRECVKAKRRKSGKKR